MTEPHYDDNAAQFGLSRWTRPRSIADTPVPTA